MNLVQNIPCLVFLGVGVFLIMNGHPVAGGWCIFISVLTHK